MISFWETHFTMPSGTWVPFAAAQGSAVVRTPERTNCETSFPPRKDVARLMISDGDTILLGLYVTYEEFVKCTYCDRGAVLHSHL